MTEILVDTPPMPSDLLRRLHEDEVSLVSLQFVDIAGMLKTVTVPDAQIASIIERGKWFDGSSIDAFARTAESDMYLWPDLSTYAVVPWKTGSGTAARLLCWVRTPPGDPFPGDPRAALARLLDRARRQGYTFTTAAEVEFFLLPRGHQGAPSRENRYFSTVEGAEEDVLEEAVDLLRRMDLPVLSLHHEVAPHQHEVELGADDPLRSADAIVTVVWALRALAARHDLTVTFMPKPWAGVNGSGMHTHQHVHRVQGEGAGADEYGLSVESQAFIAGQLLHGRGMCALIAPLVNSYKRFVRGYEAPIYLSWARHNRSAFIRIPQFDAESASIELRAPDPSSNPYLAFAGMLACGLDGIAQELPLPPPVEETLYAFDGESVRRQSVGTLPRTLGEALSAMEDDEVVQEAIGDYLYSRFLELKSLEWESYLEHVDTWELDRYFDDGNR